MLCRAHWGHAGSLPLACPVNAWCSCPVIGCFVTHMFITPPVVPGLSLSCGLLPAVRLLPLTSSAWFLPLPSGVYKGPLVIFSFIVFCKPFGGLK